MRSATMKGSIRCQPPKPHLAAEPPMMGSFGNILETMETQQEETSDVGETDGHDGAPPRAAANTPHSEDPPPTIVRISALGSMTEDTSSMNGKVQVCTERRISS